MANKYDGITGGVSVIPSDSVDITTNTVYSGLACTGAGAVKVDVVDVNGVKSTLTLSLAVGFFLPCSVTRVYAVGTIATGIVAVR